MKFSSGLLLLTLLVLLAVGSAACLAQSQKQNSLPVAPAITLRAAPDQNASSLGDADLDFTRNAWNQTGCPVVLTGASVATKARYMPVNRYAPSETPGLDLRFRNMSGKAIRSAAIRVQVRYKQSIYDLDSTTRNLFLTVAGTGITDGERELSRLIPLRSEVFGLGLVELKRVNYADGSVWKAEARNSCGFERQSMLAMADR